MNDTFEQWWSGFESSHPIQYSTAKIAWNAAIKCVINQVVLETDDIPLGVMKRQDAQLFNLLAPEK